MNGVEFPVPQLQTENPLVAMLNQALAEVKAGRLTSLAIIGVSPQGAVVTPYNGPRRGDLHLGAAILQQHLMNEFVPPTGGRSSLVRATMVG